ncbi:alcohol dehydrogenase catalytic domain-containing protein [Streptomyces coeruleorubidus]
MLASWYDEQGPAADVLHVGELPDPTAGPGEVRVRVTVSGVNPGDTKKRRGWLGSSMPYPRVIPHSDAAGVIDAVGDGVDAHRVGQRVWVYGAQSYRPFGTAAQYTVVPADLAVPLPDHLSDELGAGLGIPGITAHRTVFSDGPVDGQLMLVHGVLGGVGSLAAQLARWGGATVIGTVRHGSDQALAMRSRLDSTELSWTTMWRTHSSLGWAAACGRTVPVISRRNSHADRLDLLQGDEVEDLDGLGAARRDLVQLVRLHGCAGHPWYQAEARQPHARRRGSAWLRSVRTGRRGGLPFPRLHRRLRHRHPQPALEGARRPRLRGPGA